MKLFNFLAKISELFVKESEEIDPKLQAVIVGGIFESGEQFGSHEEQDNLFSTEKALQTAIENIDAKYRAEYDGHDLGEGTFVLYMYSYDADRLFSIIELILKKSKLNHLTVTLQYGPPNNPNTVEKIYAKLNNL